VTLPPERRGILTHGSVLVLTSVADRTSPVMRGKWVMEVMMGSPPPAPPADVPAFEATKAEVGRQGADRARAHGDAPRQPDVHVVPSRDRSDRARLENFDVTGKYRIKDSGVTVDRRARCTTARRSKAGQPARALLKHQDVVLLSFTENLMTYALGRRIEGPDMWAVRRVIRDAEKKNLKISAFVQGVATSPLFTMGRVTISTDVSRVST
jgi:hypothetical protein